MKILISNDDGIESNGLIELAKRLAVKNDVLVIAPDGNRSACAHSLSINVPLKLNKIDKYGFDAYSLSGTPVDCVKFAKLHFSSFEADVVLAGINKAHNVGSDILYSGTVAIATEAAFLGNVAFAFSAFNYGESDFALYASYAEEIVNKLLPISLKGDIWNINFPDASKSIKGVVITKLGIQMYSDRYERLSENEYYLTGELIEHDKNDEDCDIEWLKKGYITPILFNKTNHRKIDLFKEKCIKL